jgi:hypothetical protein
MKERFWVALEYKSRMPTDDEIENILLEMLAGKDKISADFIEGMAIGMVAGWKKDTDRLQCWQKCNDVFLDLDRDMDLDSEHSG